MGHRSIARSQNKLNDHMNLDTNTLRKIAHLSRLDFNEADEQKMIESLSSIISWVEKLGELDTTGVEPLTHLTLEINTVREDLVANVLPRAQGLQHAPRHDGTFFRVPKVIE
jgi:aspartyl-tRNA(Asn)/glutamyl-tRNA(Gln) amidotransferase subunit C